MSLNLPQGMQITAPIKPEWEAILSTEALEFVAKLHRAFEARRQELLKARIERQARIDAGEMPDFLPETKHIREGDWKVAPVPAALQCRRVEITGPGEAKMIIGEGQVRVDGEVELRKACKIRAGQQVQLGEVSIRVLAAG